MFKKIILMFLLLTVSILSFSCSFTKQIKPESPADWKRKKGHVGGVVTVSGDRIEFSEENPGKILNNCIIGDAKKEIEIEHSNIDKIERNYTGKIITIKTKDGNVYQVKHTIPAPKHKRIIIIYEPIKIPLSEVEMAWKKIDIGEPLFKLIVYGSLIYIGAMSLLGLWMISI